MRREMVWWTLVLKAALVIGWAPAALADGCRIAVLGDSLTAGYGLPVEQAFPAKLEESLRGGGYDCEVINAGVSGDTSAGGLARLDWTLADQPSHVIVELGANDGLRALPPAEMEANLDAILSHLGEEGVPALLTGMLAPPNLGRLYGEEFEAVFETLAQRHDVPLYPFFLDGVAAEPSLNQPDGIHPNAAGVEVIVEGILPEVEAWLNETYG